jgi:DNA-directed RNA polymerase alpha subunit
LGDNEAIRLVGHGKEDVPEIILNIKSLVLKFAFQDPQDHYH